MATQKALRVIYQSKNKTTGLTDVKAQIYYNGTAKAVGGSAILLSELDATNSPGLYEAVISPSTLTSWGVAAGTYNALEAYVDSASQPAAAPFKAELTVANLDDIDATTTSIKSDTSAIKTDLESGTYSLQNLSAKLDQIINNAGFAIPVPSQLSRPSSGSTLYRIPLTIYNDANALIDPDGQSIVVTLANTAGTDRGSYLTGYSGGSAPAVRDSLGQYHIDVTIASTAVDEELIFTFSYAISSVATARKSTTIVVDQVTAAGLAQQTTLLDVQTRVTDIQSKVNDSTFGLSAANTLQNAIKTQTDKIGDSTIGLAAIKAAEVAIQGSGFTGGTDDLHSLSTFIRANLYQGGKAV